MPVNRLRPKCHSVLLVGCLLFGGCYTEGRASPSNGAEGERERFAWMADCTTFAERYVTYECRRYSLGFLRETREWVAGDWVRRWPDATQP